MEEQQIKDFVQRVSSNETLRKELAQNPDGVIMREGFSPRVTQIVARLVPHMAFGDTSNSKPWGWWSR